jgi:L-lactate dehydrogenase complex protein LldG
MTARDEVLGRIAAALGRGGQPASHQPAGGQPASQQPALLGRPAPAGTHPAGTHPAGTGVPRGYRTRGDAGPAVLLSQLADRLTDYRAVVRRVTEDQVAGAVGDALTRRGASRVVLPPGLGLDGLPPGIEAVVDDGLPASELDGVDGVITGAAVAIAETGTIILDGSAGQGRRALSLIPDYHLCLLRAGQVVALVPEALARLEPGRPLTWISGPSATSDIELDRVEGVHGPRTLEVILIEPSG